MKPEMIPLLRKGVEWVESEVQKPWIDRRWWQNVYRMTPTALALGMLREDMLSAVHLEQVAAHCGTCYCIAGWMGQELDPRYAESEVINGVHVADFVMQELGLDHWEAKELFSGNNGVQSVRAIAEAIAGEPL